MEKEFILEKIADIESQIELFKNSMNEIDRKILHANKILESKFDNIIQATDAKINSSNEINKIVKDFDGYINNQKEAHDNILKFINTEFNQELIKIKNIYNEVNEVQPKVNEINDALEETRETLDSAKDIQIKITAIQKNVISVKNDIDVVFYELNGQDKKNDDGTVSHIDGLSDKLKNNYEMLSSRISNSFGDLEAFKVNFNNDLNKMQEAANNNFQNFFANANTDKESILTQINKLLPNALTAGLSSAYNEKRKHEEEESRVQQKIFKYSIYAMTVFALMPIAININLFYFKNENIDDLIKNFPYLLSVILPLYIPVLWLANSANKRINLSKRLIEEYSHKEALSKTFEGLSNQISEISQSNKDLAIDLRSKLLYNLLEVSSENPGKLISDYRKGDHPLMDALEKSTKLADAFKKLADIPGFKAIAQKLADKSNEIQNEQLAKVKNGLTLSDSTPVQSPEK